MGLKSTATDQPQALLAAMSDFINGSYEAMNLEAVRLAMQGPLKPYFAGIQYDPVKDKFTATTDYRKNPHPNCRKKARPIKAAKIRIEISIPQLEAKPEEDLFAGLF